ncbi:MAG TPA: hypothetical protein VFI60_11470, partial [Candidatus Acidoferrum sp.]|nr:hypothetical protein [Candidatus Acidoferrum sp.]
PGAKKVLQLLEGSARAMADKGQFRAIGIAIDVRLKQAPDKEDEGRDAIWTFLERKDATPVNVYTPYTKGLSGEYIYRAWFANHGEPRFFVKKH